VEQSLLNDGAKLCWDWNGGTSVKDREL